MDKSSNAAAAGLKQTSGICLDKVNHGNYNSSVRLHAVVAESAYAHV